MPLRPVPWFTGEGAENHAELARADTFVGSSGATGIVSPTDFKVVALPTPGAAVRVRMGTGVIKSTYPNVFGQSYVVQEDSFTDVPVAATGSSGGATKYVYVLIEDTQYNGQTPVSVEDGPYNSYHVTTTLPRNQPYLLLAKITQPASTATIQNAHLTDMREVANPRKDYGVYARPRTAADGGAQVKLTARRQNGSNAAWGELFPGGAGIPNEGQIFLPDYATHMVIDARWMGIVAASSQNSWGRYWIEFGDEYRAHTWPNGQQYEFMTQQFGFNTTGSPGAYRTEWSLVDAKPIPKHLRGKTITFAFKAGLEDTGSTTGIYMDALGGVTVRVDYVEQKEDPDTI